MNLAARLFGLILLGAVAWGLCVFGDAQAQPRFPALSGRVVDQADLLTPAQETELSARLEALERDTSDQLVVVTLTDLQGYEIEDYGHQLGRAWRIGQTETDNGALLIVAAEERRVRIEVGYGLEPTLTDALSGLIIQERILPAFRDGDFPRGISEGVSAIDAQLRLDPAEAQARAAEAAQAAETSGSGIPLGAALMIAFVLFVVISGLISAMTRGGGRRRRRDSLSPVLIWAASEALRGASRGGSSWGGGGGGFSGFSGGGGSFGGGGASGGW